MYIWDKFTHSIKFIPGRRGILTNPDKVRKCVQKGLVTPMIGHPLHTAQYVNVQNCKYSENNKLKFHITKLSLEHGSCHSRKSNDEFLNNQSDNMAS